MTARLEARDLAYGYDAGTALFAGWSAAFHAGEVVAITGPSGRGKSTLLYLLGLMLRPHHGEVLLDGIALERASDRRRASARAETFGFVFQDAALDQSRSVLDNILETTLYRGERRRVMVPRAQHLMERFGVALRQGAKPGQVSGGQAQRIALCRALLGDPRVLLADEPTGNLDPASSAVVLGALHHQAANGAAVIVVTHDPALADACDRRIEL